MSEKPILFSAPMVRALLDSSKTQTRRVLKPQPRRVDGGVPFGDGPAWAHAEPGTAMMRCPYGKRGDRLWVRESFWGCDMPGYGDQPCVVYDDEWYGKEYKPAEPRPWGRKFGRIPSIHMPRECSRITLEITAVRVERLQDISEADAKAEGCIVWPECEAPAAYNLFRVLWDSINGPSSWDANPWVWVIEFKRIEA